MVSVSVFSCKSGESSFYMSESNGRSGEILIVIPDRMLDNEIGDTVIKWLRQDVLVLPQYEPSFKVIPIKPTAYNDLFKKTRNVLICDVNPNCERTEFRVETDKFARPQLYITLRAATDSAFLNAWYKVENFILDTLTAAEQARFLVGYRRYHNPQAEEALKQRHGVLMTVPTSGFNYDVDTTNFVWISKETQLSSQAILVFDMPYNGPKDFDMQNLVRRIDSVLMLNVPGPADGSYMAIEKRLEPIIKQTSRNGSYLCEMRGLWETEGDFMGGPFVSQSMVDTVKNRLVTVFGFVYGGKNDKKNLLWQVESVMSTFNIYYEPTIDSNNEMKDKLPAIR